MSRWRTNHLSRYYAGTNVDTDRCAILKYCFLSGRYKSKTSSHTVVLIACNDMTNETINRVALTDGTTLVLKYLESMLITSTVLVLATA